MCNCSFHCSTPIFCPCLYVLKPFDGAGILEQWRRAVWLATPKDMARAVIWR
jgi:hypothetical protein